MTSKIPEGIPYALPADPAASGENALEVDYSNYARDINSPISRDIVRGYAPGMSPESLTARGIKAAYTGSDEVEQPEGTPAVVSEEVPFQTAEEKVAQAQADAGQPEVPEEQPAPESGPEAPVQFDPNEHTVAEIQEHLASADEAEKERVLAAEADGQARKTLVGTE